MDAVFMYKHVTGDYFPEALVYILYFFTVYGGELGDHPLAMAIRKRSTEVKNPPRTKEDFLSILWRRSADTVDPRGSKGK